MTKTKNQKYSRLSEALRKNLVKRKEQQRNRSKSEETNSLDEPSQRTVSEENVSISKDQEEKR